MLLYSQFRFDLNDPGKPVTGYAEAAAMIDWLRVCHYERARHVVYVSTASPQLFRGADNCLETSHWRVEEKLRQLHTLGGLQHFTIPRPVTIMTIQVPSYTVDCLRVVARCDPDVRPQLIAGGDVGRIAALVLIHPASTYHEQTIELSSIDRLSSRQEAALRGLMTGQAVECDATYWKAYTGWFNQQGWCIPQEARRQLVSVDDTRALLLELPTYESWFAAEWKAAQEARAAGTRAHATAEQRCSVQ